MALAAPMRARICAKNIVDEGREEVAKALNERTSSQIFDCTPVPLLLVMAMRHGSCGKIWHASENRAPWRWYWKSFRNIYICFFIYLWD